MFCRSLAALLFVLSCTTPIAHAGVHSTLAPADEYFGRMKMSVLGIRNGLRDAGLRMTSDPGDAASQMSACHWLQDSIEDWGDKYPQDTWLPGMTLSLEHLYALIGTADGRAQEASILAWVHLHYPDSRFEQTVRIAVK
jgi:hypothetical protein